MEQRGSGPFRLQTLRMDVRAVEPDMLRSMRGRTTTFYSSAADTLGGRVRDTWALRPVNGSPPKWQRVFPRSDPAGRTGHTLVVADAVGNRKVEQSSATVSNCTNLSGAERWLYFYPQTFLLPGGRVALTGPEPSTQILDPATPVWENRTSAYTTGNDNAGSSVSYLPGKIMKCGFQFDPPSKRAYKIAFSGSGDTSSGWVGVDSMKVPRFAHNLTILPTGEVLVTGGTLQRLEDGSNLPVTSAARRPQLWNPNSGAWSDTTLAADPAMRDYHSIAVLLPDGRVPTAGGESSNNPDRTTGGVGRTCRALHLRPRGLHDRLDASYPPDH